MSVALELNLARNLFGPIKIEYRRKIIHYLNRPTTDGWSDIASIIINFNGGPMETTLWQGVCSADPSFPKTGRITNINDKIVKEWERIPSPKLVTKAMFYLTH